MLGLGWPVAGLTAGVLGAPLPDHVRELLTRGRGADGSRTLARLGVEPVHSTVDVLKDLYEWAPVTYLGSASVA